MLSQTVGSAKIRCATFVPLALPFARKAGSQTICALAKSIGAHYCRRARRGMAGYDPLR